MPTLTAREIADHVDARIEGDPERPIGGVGALGSAGPGDLAFLERSTLRERVLASPPGALLAREGVEIPTEQTTVLRVPEPQLAFARALELLHPPPPRRPGIHTTAVVGRRVRLGREASIAAGAVIEEGAVLGDRCDVGPGALIGAGVRLGDDCRIGHAASILTGSVLGDRVFVQAGARIGSEGYGFVRGAEGMRKIPQIGGCVVGDDVEIGANCTVDRGALGDTEIGARTKLDNLVHVGHNVRIGEDCMIVAQVGIAGSTTIGKGAALAGQAGVAGHLTVGPGARIAARSAVFKDVPAGATFGGYPARPHRAFLRASAALLKLPRALARISAIEAHLGLERPAREEEPPAGSRGDPS